MSARIDPRQWVERGTSALAGAAVVGLLVGCGMLAPPKAEPVVEVPESANDGVRAIATTAERRLILIRQHDGGHDGDSGVSPENPISLFCAEPSPDTYENLLSTFSGALKGEGKTGGDKGASGKADGSLHTALGVVGQSMIQRTQGLQLYRDGVFALCQGAMNDWITVDSNAGQDCAGDHALDGGGHVKESCLSEYERALMHLRSDAVEVIKFELALRHLGGTDGAPAPEMAANLQSFMEQMKTLQAKLEEATPTVPDQEDEPQ